MGHKPTHAAQILRCTSTCQLICTAKQGQLFIVSYLKRSRLPLRRVSVHSSASGQTTRSQFAFHLCASVHLWASDTRDNIISGDTVRAFFYTFFRLYLLTCCRPAGHCVRSINQMVGQLAKMPRQCSAVIIVTATTSHCP